MAAVAPPFQIDHPRIQCELLGRHRDVPRDGQDARRCCATPDTGDVPREGFGRNTFQLYSSEMNVDVGERLTVKRTCGARSSATSCACYYQPKVEMKTGRIIGVRSAAALAASRAAG
jgi:hypothetical protein